MANVHYVIICDLLGCRSTYTSINLLWQSENPSISKSSPSAMYISTRAKTVAFLMSIDLWQSARWNRGSRVVISFLSEIVDTRPTKWRNVLSVESSSGGLLLFFKSISTCVYGTKYSKHTSGSAKATRLASARSAVWTISNGASCVHFTRSVAMQFEIRTQWNEVGYWITTTRRVQRTLTSSIQFTTSFTCCLVTWPGTYCSKLLTPCKNKCCIWWQALRFLEGDLMKSTGPLNFDVGMFFTWSGEKKCQIQ